MPVLEFVNQVMNCTKNILKFQVLEEKNHTKHRLLNSDMVVKLRKCSFNKEASLVNGCGTQINFSVQEHIETKETRRRLKDANFCKFRFCATCNWRRNLNINRELLQAFKAIEATRSVSYLFLTLTIKNCDTSDLKATVKHMNESFKRMSKTKAYKNTILGHFKALEIIGDETQAGEVHPHFHILLIVSNSYFKGNCYLSQEKWAEMWKKALRVDYTPIVDIRRIKPKKKKNGKQLTALQSAVFEVAKYSVKHTELTKKSDNEFTQILFQTKGMRFFSTGGILKKMINLQKIDDDLIGLKEDLEAMWIEIYEEIYEWLNGDYRLIKINVANEIGETNTSEASWGRVEVERSEHTDPTQLN